MGAPSIVAADPIDQSSLDRMRDRIAAATWVTVIVAPPLALGGVHPETVAAAAALVAAGHLMLAPTRGRSPLPRGAMLGAIAVLATLLQWIPGGAVVRASLAPALEQRAALASSVGTSAAWSGFTLAPAQTAFELAGLILGLAVFCLAARHPWRRTVGAIAWLGGVLTAIGLAHGVLGRHAIYGLYRPRSVDPDSHFALLTSFVNPNHQASVLLLGLGCAAAMALDAARRRDMAASARTADQQQEWASLYVGLAVLQAFALVLSLSRAAILAAVCVAALAAIASRPPQRLRGRRIHTAGRVWLLAPVLVAGLVAVGAHSGAARELQTLLHPSSGLAKLGKIYDDAQLLAVSPFVGVGRGGFSDVIGMVDAGPQLQTNLESVPLAMLVDWGVPVGAALLIGACAWWIAAMRRGGDDDAPARRWVLLALLAVGIQNTADFGLTLAGVALPACAAAGAVTPSGTVSVKYVRTTLATACAAAAVLASWSAPDTLAHRHETDAEIAAGRRDPTASLQRRPNDARLHRVLARHHAEAGRWEQSRAHAKVATELDLGAIDGWLLRAAAAGNDTTMSGEAARSEVDLALRRALIAARAPIPTELARWLVAIHPDPEALSARAPTDPAAWRRLAAPVGEVAPWHALALVRARLVAHPGDTDALRVGVDASFAADNAALGLHYARLWRQIAAAEPSAHLAVVRAYERFDPPRTDDAIAALEIAAGQVAEKSDRGTVAEWLVERLLKRDAPGDFDRAGALVPDLRLRAATRPATQRRNALAERVERRRSDADRSGSRHQR